MRTRHEYPSVTPLVIAGLLIAIAVMILAVSAVGAAPSCMTLAEARAVFPKDHLWWHGLDHCWDANPGLGSRKARWLPKPTRDANGNVAHHSGRPLVVAALAQEPAPQPSGPEVAYPSLMPGVGTTDEMLRSDALTSWPRILDVDDMQQSRFEPWERRVAMAFPLGE